VDKGLFSLAPLAIIAPSKRLSDRLKDLALQAVPEGFAAVRFYNLFSFARTIYDETAAAGHTLILDDLVSLADLEGLWPAGQGANGISIPAVISEPDLSVASTTIVPAESALMSLFRRGKFSARGGVSIENSLTTAPEAATDLNRASFSGG
jgi:hypothetical protein